MTPVRTILHPTDFSPCTAKAFQTACAMARPSDAQLVLLHVMEPERSGFCDGRERQAE
jgi:nucleotide-binding universal stress UspA family protein